MASNQKADHRVTRSQTRSNPQLPAQETGNSPTLTPPVAAVMTNLSLPPLPEVTGSAGQKLLRHAKTDWGHSLPILAFMLPVEQVFVMRQQHNADLKQLLLTFSRHMPGPHNNARSGPQSPR
eukprot:IDg21379t1